VKRDPGRGAWFVEVSVLLPLLALLLIGIAEFGWLHSQHVAVRAGAREGARVAATSTGLTGTQIVAETCHHIDRARIEFADVELRRAGPDSGDRVEVGVRATASSLTGFFGPLVPATLESTAESRLEQGAIWTNTGFTTCGADSN
jgi:hypothetical protein